MSTPPGLPSRSDDVAQDGFEPLDVEPVVRGSLPVVAVHCGDERLDGGRVVGQRGGGVVEPDLASADPEVSADGLTWTFSIQPGLHYAPPVEEVEITAQDFVRAMEREATPSANVGGYPFYYSVIDGFDEFASGEADEISGMKAVDDHTLEITVTRPTGDLGYRLAMPAAAPMSS